MNASATDAATESGLAARLIDAPHLSEPDAARHRFEAWLADIGTDVAAALNDLRQQHSPLDRILLGIFEHSPYLFDIIQADPQRLLRMLQAPPETCLRERMVATRDATESASSEADVMLALRALKAESALLIALCDIGGVWPVMTVTHALTDLAITSVQATLRFLLRQEVARGRLKPADPAKPEADSGMTVLAMGKMGAGELNYSSDIDLIVFFDSATTSLAEGLEPQPFYVRVTQGLSRILQQRTGAGYVFRVDLRLRPDPASTPVALSLASAMNYYEREGRTWERAAMIKARPCAGDPATGDMFLGDIAPFVWRKHLDFAALADVHDMKRQMQTFRKQSDISVEGHNVKVGRGGIREIEFFAQTQQLIAGGRHPELRVKPTLEALDVLATSNWITYLARDELTAAYLFLRRAEHRLQMIADEQTHALPDDPEALTRFAHFLGYDGRDSFAADLLGHLNRVQQHYGRLFEGDVGGTAHLPVVDFTKGPDDPRTLAHLSKLGFKQPVLMAEIIARWLTDDYRVLKVDATRQAFIEFMPALVAGLAKAEEPDNAVIAFDRLLQALHRGGRLIALLSQNPDLVGLVALVLGAAPRLGDMLARQPQIMDGLIDPRFFGAMPDQRELSARLAATLQDADSYEEFLDRLRLFGQESLFLIGTRILSGTVSARHASIAFADVAEGIVDTVHRLVSEQFAKQHGRVAQQETAILAMGKLGSREMTASSDLDLILVYDFDHETPDSDGERPLHGAQYFARLTQRLISAFTTRTNYGVLYDVDMRLRPSGRAGPLASRIDAFASYQDSEAWTWEHMALTRARVISGNPEFKAKIERVIREVLTRPRDAAIIASDVAEMRQAIALEKGEADIWDLKYAAGGMVDIEFIAQYLQLAHAADHPEILDVGTVNVLERAARLGVLPPSAFQVLRAAARLYHDLTQILRLCVSTKFDPKTAGEDLLRVMTRAADAPDFSSLEARLRETQADVRRVFQALLKSAD
jgi:glutamate-ammonia-ligase adenylyltransferase